MMLFQAVVIFLPILNFLKISCKRGKVHSNTVALTLTIPPLKIQLLCVRFNRDFNHPCDFQMVNSSALEEAVK